jgi:hypothetical protein
MRVKLQLAMCSEDGHEKTVIDVVTLKKDYRRIEHRGIIPSISMLAAPCDSAPAWS